jgi:hypothetical protein
MFDRSTVLGVVVAPAVDVEATTMTRASAITALSLAVAAGAIAALFFVMRDDPRSVAPTPSATTVPTAAPSAVPTTIAKPTVASVAIPSAVPDAFDPEIDESWKLLKPGDPPAPGDPFEEPDVAETMAKLLARVGRIRVGYLRKGATIKDETAVTNILKRAALEIDAIDRDRQDQPHRRMPEYEKLLSKYREELQRYMQGSVMIAGLGWSLGYPIDPDAG